MEQKLNVCTSCGGNMLVRKNSKTGHRFYGCSNYPNCTATAPYNSDNEEEQLELPDSNNLPSDRQRFNDKQRWNN